MDPRRETVRDLELAGYILKRRGANHDIYFNPATGTTIPVKRHDFNPNDARYIRKEAGLPPKR